MNSGYEILKEEMQCVDSWISHLGQKTEHINIVSYEQGWGKLIAKKSVIDKALRINSHTCSWGFGTHADSEITLNSPEPLKEFRSIIGFDNNDENRQSPAILTFSVWANGKCLAESNPISRNSATEKLTAQLNGATKFTLKVKGSVINWAHANWGEPEAVTQDGKILKIGTEHTGSATRAWPVSFKYNGQDSDEWFSRWGVSHETTSADNYILHRFICLDEDTGLESKLEMRQYKEIPACFWNIKFKNTGDSVSPLLENVKTLNLHWNASNTQIFRTRGSFHYEDETPLTGEAFRDNFEPITESLANSQKITMAATGGRSSVDWMPFFNFSGDNEGLTFGIGWTGQWHSEISRNMDSINFQAGMETICTRLNPGEEISQPSTLMIYWKGDQPIRGNNLLRRFIYEHLSPRDSSGKIIQAPACNLTWGGMTAPSHLNRIANISNQNIPLDYYWIDAGWYGEAGPNADEFAPIWGSQAGNWYVNRETYPNNIREVSDATHAIGKKFLLWVEPERAVQGTSITIEHPEWFLGGYDQGQHVILNMGNPEAWHWCTELVSSLIEEQGMDCYRQDFNISPLDFWKEFDEPERKGMAEIRYIEGEYAFLDELRTRFPDLLIDNCSSGGRRLDLEMMRRSIPLWASDMQCFPDYLSERNLQLVHGLSYWLPQFAFGTQNHEGDTYHFRATMAAGINVNLFSYERETIANNYPYQWLRDRLNEYHRAKRYFAGDFYPLMPFDNTFTFWTASQYHRPDLGEGLIEVFRKSESPIERICLEPQGFDAETKYEFEYADSGNCFTMTGQELKAQGFPVEIPNKRESRLFFYRSL